MMKVTAKQIEKIVYQHLKDSPEAKALSGNVYRYGMRPRDSKKEDAIVIFTAGVPGVIQRGTITVNVFVPDIQSNKADGTWSENGKRTEAVEALMAQWADSLMCSNPAYLFELKESIYTAPDDKIHQHFVVVRFNYSIL